MVVQLDGAVILDWPSFHRASQVAFGFPAFYGHNLDPWIDCLTYLYEDDGMSAITLKPSEVLDIQLIDSASLAWRAPPVLEGLESVVAAVSERHRADGGPPVLIIHKL